MYVYKYLTLLLRKLILIRLQCNDHSDGLTWRLPYQINLLALSLAKLWKRR